MNIEKKLIPIILFLWLSMIGVTHGTEPWFWPYPTAVMIFGLIFAGIGFAAPRPAMRTAAQILSGIAVISLIAVHG